VRGATGDRRDGPLIGKKGYSQTGRAAAAIRMRVRLSPAIEDFEHAAQRTALVRVENTSVVVVAGSAGRAPFADQDKPVALPSILNALAHTSRPSSAARRLRRLQCVIFQRVLRGRWWWRARRPARLGQVRAEPLLALA